MSSASSQHDSGIAPWADVFSAPAPLPGQVFALEILQRPLRFERSDGTTVMTLDRRGCDEGIFTTRGKGVLVARSVGDDIERVQAADKALHRFLLSTDDGTFEVEHDGLRWASGGVLSIVRWRDRLWTPFFFRDIPPFGWNISLGGSDKGDDLTRPEAFLEREFLEETLVLDVASATRMRPLVFAGREVDKEKAEALRHASIHIKQRMARDGLAITSGGAPIAVEPAATRMRAQVRDDEGTHEIGDVLVCVNRLEAAIEVVRALHFELNDTDIILDGELLEPAGATEPPDLIRMPVAMISHDYLSRAFGAEWSDFEYEGTLQPSVSGPPMHSDDIVMFGPDVTRRREIVEGLDAHATTFERGRYRDWTQRFGRHFYAEDGSPSTSNPLSLFTLPAAKIISYYFSHSR